MKFYETTSKKRLLGLLSILVGLIALITPFTPGAVWFIAIGLQLLGIHFIFLDKIEKRLGIYQTPEKIEKI